MSISEEACNHIKELHKTKKLYENINLNCSPVEFPSIFFMAGAPGAGKTEFSTNFVNVFKENHQKHSIARIDTDEVRKFCPQYTGGNSSEIQKAAVRGVNYLYDYCLKKKYNILLDGTFSDFNYAKQNVERALKRGDVQIFYIFRDPQTSWKFTLAREKIEGRKVNVEIFIKSFFNSFENVKEIKKIFNKKIKLDILKRGDEDKMYINVSAQDVDKIIKFEYDNNTLLNILKNIGIE